MRSQLKHGPGYAGARPDRSGIREEADAQRPGSGARPAPFGTVTRKDAPLWTKARPLTPGLLGLALAVVLWGLEYKVSLYHPHPNHSARVNVAKLWVGPRTAAFTKNNCVRKSTAHSPELHLLTSSSVSAFDSNDGARCQVAESIPGTEHLSDQRAPRSPPSV
jgi:hypothetical protein